MQDTKFRVIRLKENQGLGRSRQLSIQNAKYNLVAVMDSDDLCVPQRFELQLETFRKNPEIGVLGGQIIEFDGSVQNAVSMRMVPLSDEQLKKYIKKRCPFNHMTVMLNRQKVLAAGGYRDWFYDEDYYLWLRMYLMNDTFANLKDVLCYVRVNDDMYQRRGGKKYFESERKLQQFMLKKQIISKQTFVVNVLVRFLMQRMCPNVMRKLLYRFTRKQSPKCQRELIENAVASDGRRHYGLFSVAMSVYGKDNPQYFDAALESILNQTCPPAEIVLVVDGSVPAEIEFVIGKYKKKLRSTQLLKYQCD